MIAILLCWIFQPQIAAANPEAQCERYPPRTELSTPFTLVSWNIEKGADSAWPEVLKSLPYGVSLVLLQEAYQPNGLIHLGFDPAHQWFAPGYLSKTQQTGVLTAARATALRHCRLQALEPWLGTPKAVSITDFNLHNRDQTLRVINVHAVNFELGAEALEAQLAALEPFISDHQGPLVLAGDFNTWSAARGAVLMSLVERSRLTAVTFDPDHRTTALGFPLDHILLRGLNALSANVVVTDHSDHNLLRVTLQLSSPE